MFIHDNDGFSRRTSRISTRRIVALIVIYALFGIALMA